jgi:hypothetical protein
MKTPCFALGLALSVLSISSLAGCGDDSETGSGGGDAGSGGDTAASTSTASTSTSTGSGEGGQGGAGGAPAETITFTVTLTDALAAEPTVLAGVEVCAADRDDVPCATSDGDGFVEMELPANSELMLRCAGADYGPMYMTWAIGESDIAAGQFGLIAENRMMPLFVIAGAEAWPEKGAILVNVYDELEARDTRVAGATFTISPDEGGGPVYVNEQPLPDPELEATTLGGPAVFFDLEDGEVEITVAHPDRDCVAGFGWPGASPASLRSRIFAGGLSSITFVCPP